MTALKVNLEEATQVLEDLTKSTPERIKQLREELNDARFDLIQQRLLVKWYTWVTQMIEALGPDWEMCGDGSSVDGCVDMEDGDEEVYVTGEVEFYLVDEANDPADVHLCLEAIGEARLFWSVGPEEGADLIVCGDTATDVASVINEKVTELRAVKAAKESL
jgi:hypothetical protein